MVNPKVSNYKAEKQEFVKTGKAGELNFVSVFFKGARLLGFTGVKFPFR